MIGIPNQWKLYWKRSMHYCRWQIQTADFYNHLPSCGQSSLSLYKRFLPVSVVFHQIWYVKRAVNDLSCFKDCAQNKNFDDIQILFHDNNHVNVCYGHGVTLFIRWKIKQYFISKSLYYSPSVVVFLYLFRLNTPLLSAIVSDGILVTVLRDFVCLAYCWHWSVLISREGIRSLAKNISNC